MKADTTIAILSHNRSWHLAQCIASIREFTESPYTIKVLDVASDLNHIEHSKQLAGPDIHFDYCDDFLSCLAGRRMFLDSDIIDTKFVVYLDDDIRVGPLWLSNLRGPMLRHKSAAVVASNIVQEGKTVTSGVREIARAGRHLAVRMRPFNYMGEGELSLGGATLYRTDILRRTELREEFSGGYEDWDQTLQITRDLGRTVHGSRSVVFHYHMGECAGYFKDRWRWRELLESALGIFDRWGIRTAVDKSLRYYLEREIVIPRDLAERVVEVIT